MRTKTGAVVFFNFSANALRKGGPFAVDNSRAFAAHDGYLRLVKGLSSLGRLVGDNSTRLRT